MKQKLQNFLEEQLRQHPGTASFKFISEQGCESIQDSELIKRAKEFSRVLIKKGFQAKNRAILLGENSLPWMIVYLAVLYANGVIVTLDTELLPDVTCSLLKKVDPSIIFCGSSQANKIKTAIDLNVPVLTLQKFDKMIVDLASLPEMAQSALNNNDYDESVASIVNSSGTGGKLKGILLTHQNLIDVLSFYQQEFSLLNPKNILCVLPCYAIYPCAIALAALANGKAIYFADTKKIALITILRRYSIECLPFVPLGISMIHANIMKTVAKKGKLTERLFALLTQVSCFLRRYFHVNVGKRLFPTIHQSLGSYLNLILTGGAPLNPNMIKDFYAWGYTIMEGYGLTETAGVVAVTRGEYNEIGSCGKPVPGMTIIIDQADATGCGDILISTSRHMMGYFRDPESNEQAFLPNGLLKTGDLGQLDQQGRLHILGRSKDVIVCSDERKVLPDDVEKQYQQLPGIEKIAVVGITDELTKTDVIHAAIVLDKHFLPIVKEDKNAQAKELEKRKELEKAVFERAATLPPYLRIMQIHFFDELPTNALGKVKRAELRDKINIKE